MNERIIEKEADSLEEVRQMLAEEDDIIVLQEFILCGGKLETVESTANTVEEAIRKAANRIPAGAKVMEKTQEVKIAPKRIVLRVAGDNEESAGKGKAEVIESVSLHKKGRKGFLGLGKTLNVYEVVVSQQAVVEVRFREKARVWAKVRGYLAEDLLEIIQELRQRNASWKEILQFLNPKNDPEIRALLNELQRLNPPSVLDAIEAVCRKNKKAKWRVVIEEAVKQAAIARAEIEAEIKRQEEAAKEAQRQAAIARAREAKERDIKLRRLDIEVAEIFLFYTSIHWDKGYLKVTGIPKYNYVGPYHPLDERERKTIPYYSTDQKAFVEVERRVKGGTSLYELYKQFLDEAGQDEITATLEQKCVASVRARKSHR